MESAGWPSHSPTPAQLIELFEQIKNGQITKEELQAFLRGERPVSVDSLLADWQKFYKEVFGLEVDFSDLVVPPKQKGFDRLIIVAEEMTPKRLYQKCAELFPCQKMNKSLDEVQSEIISKDGAYAAWFRNRLEPDEELKGLSAQDLKRQGIVSITLEERFLYELYFFKETGDHLDRKSWTLCAGSCDSVGHVPWVHWDGEALIVIWCPPEFSHAQLGSRRAIRAVL